MPIAVAGSHFCCGVSEIGNFNYVKDRGPRGFSHYHKVGGTWAAQKAADPTTEEELKSVLRGVLYSSGAVFCTTGADQEYMEPILRKVGFREQLFKNNTHEKGEVKLWLLLAHEYKP